MRITPNELRFQTREFRQPHRINGSHAHGAFHFALQHIERDLKFVAPAQDIAAHFKIELSGLGNGQRTAAAVQQRHAHLLLQILQVLADGRLADAIYPGALADAPAVRYISEKLEAIEIHLFHYSIRFSNEMSM